MTASEDASAEAGILCSDPSRPDSNYFRVLFDAMPCPVLIVDSDVRIRDANPAGFELIRGKEGAYQRRGGELLKCIHSAESPEGCGHSPVCADCVVRNSVIAAAAGGKPARLRARMEVQSDAGHREVYLLVTASPFQYEGKSLVLLVLEDINELMALKALLPICAWCRRIRDDDNYWQSVESYFKRQVDVDFSHGICPECASKYMCHPSTGLHRPAS